MWCVCCPPWYAGKCICTIFPPCHSWNALVHKNFDIERTCLELESDIHTLQQQAGETGVSLN